MKIPKVLLVVAIVAATAILSCNKSGVSSDFDKSYSTFLAFKKSSGNTYTYIAVHDVKDATYSETTITIKQGEITARDFLNYEYEFDTGSNTTTKTLTDQWHETANTLGTHGTEGAQLLTLDDIYYQAQNIWLKADKSKNVITFQTNNNGMISAAGYTPNSCVSDCFIGVNIKSITN
ncbi:hypothetical protein [Mucilaginibacter sp. dw_454]|uniref:hypothetical protein n=1 Tax=Mucilaginibacter sp. dw_454 TaxID=2720079 RepID=UPI001BD3FFA1|nr:hypothetical protein [Mucilaginibacter sp. dw_454]